MNILQKVGKLATSPKAYLVYGFIALGVGAYETVKASRKVDDILDEAKEEITEIKNANEGTELKEKDYPKQLGEAYVKHGVKLVKTYAPAVIFDAVGVALICKSHSKLNGEKESLKLALAGVANGYSSLSQRVKDTIGEEEGAIFNNGLTERTESVGDEKSGEVKTVPVADRDDISPYAKFFDELSMFYKDNPELNKEFVMTIEKEANRKLKMRRYLLLNDVYAMLGLEETNAGEYVGWYLEKGEEPHISFDIFNVHRNRRFVNGLEPVVLLDFNVDGVIVDRI